jgi:hypothetical protein
MNNSIASIANTSIGSNGSGTPSRGPALGASTPGSLASRMGMSISGGAGGNGNGSPGSRPASPPLPPPAGDSERKRPLDGMYPKPLSQGKADE